jgi:UDP-N-acetylglucosamine--N-acetylmuramyl-(pentapeptide) pyrophosphoryl-undecaprenol N-acetylglucosamine transferase
MKLIIAGGGTGGHVFPAIAVAQALKKIDENSEILFIGTKLGIEKSAVAEAGYPIEFIHISGIKGRSLAKKLHAFYQIPFALLSSIKILRQKKPDALLGVGGYASGPSLLAAWMLRIPTAILEPNSIPGFTNRILGFFANKIFGAFHRTARHFSKKRFIVVGSPLRQEFLYAAAPKKKTEYGVFQILVVGGSLGAKALNDSIPKALSFLKNRHQALHVIHQTGKNDFERIQQIYKEFQIDADVRPFITNMAATYAEVDLIICRAGAGTCAEITAIGLPSILIPFPQAIYDHQTENAKELVEAGAAILISQNEINPERLALEIFELIQKPTNLKRMHQAALALGKKDAAEQIAKSALASFK